MASATRTIRVRFDGNAKGLIAAAAQAGIAVEGFEKQVKKSAVASTAVIGGGLIDALGSLPSVLKGAAIVAAVGVGAVMAPALASAIISGTLLAVGGGALAAGIVGAAKSPQVVNAWKKFGRQATVVFDRFSKPFIKPLERAASTFGRALARAEPTINRIGQTMAPIIDKLAPAFASMAEKALPGILAAVQASVPLFDVLADNLPGIGTSIAGFFDKIAQGMPAAQVFFDRFLGWVENLLPKLGGFLTWLSDLGTKMDAFTKGPEFTGLVTALTNLKDNVLAGVKKGFDDIRISVGDNSETWKTLAGDIEKVVGLLGPVFGQGVHNTLTGISFMITAFAKLYEAVRKVAIIIKELFSGSDKLPSTGGQEFGRIPGRARGGPVGAHRSYLVGEKGEPEVLTMGARSGYITPLSDAGTAESHAMGGSSFEVHVYLGDTELRDMVKVEVNECNRRTRRAVLAGSGAR